MKKIAISFLLALAISHSVFAQTDQELIHETLDNFIEGTTYNYPDRILDAFYPGTPMFLHNDADTVMIYSAERYADLYKRRIPGSRNNRIGTVLGIEVIKDIAWAKIETLIPGWDKRFIDLVLLKQIEGHWKIISKAATANPIPKTVGQMMVKPAKEVVAENLNRPWSLAFLSEEEVIIAEKDGDLVRVNLVSKERRLITGLPKDVARAVEIDTLNYGKGIFPSGLYGKTLSLNAGWFQVLLDPDYEENHYLYISYAAENKKRESTTKVVRGKLVGNELTDVQTIFVAAPYSHGLFHYGGGMIFGNDGKLYITTGERNFYEYMNPEIPVAQDLSDPRGKVIRIHKDGSIPEDNPDFGAEAVPGLYASGIRASQGLALDPRAGNIWFSEHGTIQGDELNILTPGSNYGWPNRTTGGYRTKDYNPSVIPGATFTDPIYSWDHTVAPTGLTFYRGREFPQWNGNLIVPGLSKGSLWRMIIEGDTVIGTEELFINDRVRLRKAVVSPQGKLYVLTDEENGKLIRVKNLNSGLN